MKINLRFFFQIGRQWWWLLLLAPLLAGGSASYSVSKKQKLYSSTATVQINPPAKDSSVSMTTFDTSQTFVETYRQLITTTSVLQPVVEQLQLPYDVNALKGKVSTSAVAGTQLVHISVSDPVPAEAAAIANQIASEFADFSKARSAQISSPYRTALDQQINDTKRQITAAQQQIDQLQTGTDAATAEVKGQVDTLKATLTNLQTTYNTLIVTANQMDLASAGAQTTVLVAQDATPATAPYAPKTKLYTLLGLFAGLCLAVGAVGLFEYLDNTVKASLNFQELASAPLLSIINTIPKLHQGKEQLFVLSQPKSSTAESVRLLRTNIEFAAVSREISSLTITSPGPGEGKSTVTANLAAAMAQRGFTVAVIDADLRRPSQHKIFGVRNDRGLTSLLTHPDTPWIAVATEMIEGRLFVIPSGPIPPNPGDLLGSERFQRLLAQIKEQVDIVLVDTPPVLAVSDPLVVSTATSGVVLVCRANRTRVEALARAAGSFPETVRRVGVVLNQQDKRGGESYYYYTGYYGSDDPTSPNSAEPIPSPMRALGGRETPSPSAHGNK